MRWKDWPLTWETSAWADVESPQASDMVIVMAERQAMREDGELLLHPELDKEIRERYARGQFTGEPGEAVVIPGLGLIPEKYALYVGSEAAKHSPRKMREAAAGMGQTLIDYQIVRASARIPAKWLEGASDGNCENASSAFMEGLLLGLYRRNSASAQGRVTAKLNAIEFRLGDESALENWSKGLRRGYAAANAVCYARELTNEPANLLTPARLAEEAVALAERYDMTCQVYDEKEAERAGMGGLLAVGGGSANPPRMIVLRHQGSPDAKETLGLVGKGVTFDTGGISLKKAEGMEEMISDMGGAAAVLGAMRAIGEFGLAANVVAVIPAAENMPSGSAFKPGDVIRTSSGLTVEVLNTDAEGRIVLADGLTTAIRHGATKLIDVATLTGAVMHALGDWTTGAFTNDETMLERFRQASDQAGEYVWPLPTYPEYRKLLRSDVADLKNHGGSWAGAIAGALFIGAFAEERPWIHLDIGGTAWMWSDRGMESKGGTGVMVRSLIEYIRRDWDISG
jgi:leucyl aminopeptidase